MALKLYTGYAGGSWYNHNGAAPSMLCLPPDPEWLRYSDKKDYYVGYVYGAEYEDWVRRTESFFGKNHESQDIPCVVCCTESRSSRIMIPEKISCSAGWTHEYYGYLMTGWYNYPAATDYYCVDESPEEITGREANKDGFVLYFLESRCGSLQCPPYVDGREMTCVVCTK